jgi:hypothetical protein
MYAVEEALTTAIIEGDDLRLQALLDSISPPKFKLTD